MTTDARTARSEVRWKRESPTVTDTVVYIGTPVGLASLILDISAADVADGITVVPAISNGDVRDACLRLLEREVLPILETQRTTVETMLRAG